MLKNLENPNNIRMMTIRQIAATGLLPEYTLRRMVKSGQVPAMFSGNRALVNYGLLVKLLNGEATTEQHDATEG